jgi:hypothetical protein
MPFQRFELFSIFQTDDKIRRHGLFDRYGRLLRDLGFYRRPGKACQSGMDIADQLWQLPNRYWIV